MINPLTNPTINTGSYFLCGIGGSGMLPLALILQAQGHRVEGSDRALDQGRTGRKFDYLRGKGIALHAQDGSGVTDPDQIVVASTAVEDTVPDIVSAAALGARRVSRAEMLATLFNAASCGIGIAGTSGKSTVTGMVAWILHQAGRDPTVMNGAIMKNFIGTDEPFASALVGSGDAFVSEVDESDGSIALFNPAIAVLNNVSEDHKSMDELRQLFADFTSKAQTAVMNLDDPETVAIGETVASGTARWFSLEDPAADLFADDLKPSPEGIEFRLHQVGKPVGGTIQLRVPGAHNVANALAALGAACAAGVPLAEAAAALNGYAGLRRRLETVGTANGITVIDDFGHNPDKIAATLNTLHAFPGRLLILFQPHGFGPLRNMKQGFIDCFATLMTPDDLLLMPEPVYFGGTTRKDISSADITTAISARGRQAKALPDRGACGDRLLETAQAGDRIVVMGARDDTLTTFAQDILERLQ